MLQLSDISPAIDFQKKGGWEQYMSPEYAAYKPEYQLDAAAATTACPGVGFAGIAYNQTKVKPEQAPKTWKDIINPVYKDGISVKLATSGMQHSQWYILRKMYGNDFWQEFAKQRPKGFDARAQLFDRLAKGDDRMCALAEYAGYTLYQEKGAEIDFVAPPDGMPAIADLHRRGQQGAPSRRRPSSSSTGRCPSAARRSTRTRRSCSTARSATTPARWPPASGCPTSSCSSPPTGTTTWRATPCS